MPKAAPNGYSTANSGSRTTSPEASKQGILLEVKRVDKVHAGGKWKLKENHTHVPEEKNLYESYAEYAIIISHKIMPARGHDIPEVKIRILIQSDCLIRVLSDVMKGVPRISWNRRPCKVEPQLLLAHLPKLKGSLSEKCNPADDDQTFSHLSFMIKFLTVEYDSTIHKVESLLLNNEITFDLLWAIFLPRSIILTSCNTTSEPRAVSLVEMTLSKRRDGTPFWNLICEYVDGDHEGSELEDMKFGIATLELAIAKFDGVMKISELSAYPLEWHPQRDDMRQKLLNRGRKWAELNGVRHVHYDGVAYKVNEYLGGYTRVTVSGRVMVDKGAFARQSGSDKYSVTRSLTPEVSDLDDPIASSKQSQLLSEEHTLLTTPVLFGFSLVDKRWLEFNVEHVSPIQWNNEAFENLAIEPRRKKLFQSLVQSHAQERLIDDFIEGKGLGLVFNLFGPPGVGKSLTVETISEHLKRPLYILGAGDLGTDTPTLDSNLKNIFYAAAKWNAIVLIDEADVFLEERGSADLERNAMVSVFLRQIEYFRGILFLTTNRIKSFDPAFQSRIHLSLNYKDLSLSSKEKIWRGFLSKAKNSSVGAVELTDDQITQLSNLDLNGRQIKNVIKIAISLADDEKQPLNFSHLLNTVEVMQDAELQ